MLMLGLEHHEGERRARQQQQGGVVDEAPVVKHFGLLERQIVAGRTADQRKTAQAVVESAGHDFLAHAQAVDQHEGKGILRRQLGNALAQRLLELMRKPLAAAQVEIGKVFEQRDFEKQVVAVEADARQAAFAVTGRADLARRRTADHGRRAEMLVQRRAEPLEVEGAGEENNDQTDPGLLERRRQLADGRFGIVQATASGPHPQSVRVRCQLAAFHVIPFACIAQQDGYYLSKCSLCK